MWVVRIVWMYTVGCDKIINDQNKNPFPDMVCTTAIGSTVWSHV